jgi:predicted nucleic acid-binding protein
VIAIPTNLRVYAHRAAPAEIAAIAHENGARELWSHDRHFRTVPGLRVVDPIG